MVGFLPRMILHRGKVTPWLDVKFIRQNPEVVRKKMLERGMELDMAPFIGLDTRRRDILQEVEGLRNDRNTVSKQIGEKKKNKEDASDLIERMGKSPRGSRSWTKISKRSKRIFRPSS